MTLEERYASVCEEYRKAFAERHGYNLEDCEWATGNVGDGLCCGEHYYDFDKVRFDIDHSDHIPERAAIQHLDWWLGFDDATGVMTGKRRKDRHVNYRTWCFLHHYIKL